MFRNWCQILPTMAVSFLLLLVCLNSSGVEARLGGGRSPANNPSSLWESGQTYCKTQDRRLPTKEEFCELQKTIPIERKKIDANKWAPVLAPATSDAFEKEYVWIRVGSEEACESSSRPTTNTQVRRNNYTVFCAPEDPPKEKKVDNTVPSEVL